jgi:hypothetical protein
LQLCRLLVPGSAAQDYLTALQPKGLKLAVLNLYNRQQEELMDRIHNLWAAAADFVEVLSKDSVDEMPRVVAHLITEWFSKELQEVAVTAAASPPAAVEAAAPLHSSHMAATAGFSSSSSSRQMGGGDDGRSGADQRDAVLLCAPAATKQPFLLEELRKGLDSIGSITYDDAAQQGGTKPGAMYMHSVPHARIPFLEAAAAAIAAAPLQTITSSALGSADSSIEQQVEHVQAALSEYHANMIHSHLHAAAVSDVQQLWQQGLSKPSVRAEVDQLVQVLESHVLPHNKHTRRRAAESGPSLHIPGLVKAVSSNFSYTKIFARKAGGGKRQYKVALLLDVSQSMQGHLAQCALEALMMMAEALGQVRLVRELATVCFQKPSWQTLSVSRHSTTVLHIVMTACCWPASCGCGLGMGSCLESASQRAVMSSAVLSVAADCSPLTLSNREFRGGVVTDGSLSCVMFRLASMISRFSHLAAVLCW